MSQQRKFVVVAVDEWEEETMLTEPMSPIAAAHTLGMYNRSTDQSHFMIRELSDEAAKRWFDDDDHFHPAEHAIVWGEQP